MKFYYVTDSILDDRVVHAAHIDEVCKNLLRLGHAVKLYAPTTTLGSPKQYEIVFIPTAHFLRSLFYQMKLFFRLFRDARRERPDVIYCRQSQFLFIPSIVAKLLKIPSVMEVNGRLIEEMKQANTTTISRILLAFGIFDIIEHMNIRLAAGCIVVSPGIKDYLVTSYRIDPTRVVVIPNGVDTEIFKPLAASEARTRINLQKNTTYIGYIGSLHSWQGLHYVADAVPLVCAERPNIKFLIIGDGGDADYLSKFIKDNRLETSLDLKSAVSHDLAPLYINAMDICLSYPLKIRASAASPFKVYEYLSCGKPTVVSDIGGIRDEFGTAVSYVEPESPRALATTLISLIDHKNDWERLGKNARAFIEEGHSWNIVAKKTVTFCEKIK